jgi:hypothetical protein
VRKAGLALPIVALAFVLLKVNASSQSLSYSSGQNVSPAFEGWEKNDDGSYSFLFGYMNRNWDEEIDVPVGPDNNIEPGGPDQGQPTHLLPRRNRFIFKVKVPADFGQKEMIWTLTTHGKTEKAYATLRTDYFIDDVVKASETGALGAGTSSPEMRSNKAPVVKIDGPRTLSVKAGQPLPIAATVADDGLPRRRGGGGGGNAAAAAALARGRGAAGAGAGRAGAAANGGAPATGGAPARAGGDGDGSAAASPAAGARGRGAEPAVPPLLRAALNPPSRITVGKVLGLHMMWFVYRGAGNVTFDPSRSSRGKTPAPAPTRRGRRCGSPRRCRPTIAGPPRSPSIVQAPTYCTPAPTTGR